MPTYAFQVIKGKFSDCPRVEAVLDDAEAARQAAAKIFTDLIRGIVPTLTETEPEWHIDVLDEVGKRLFRFRIIAETLA